MTGEAAAKHLSQDKLMSLIGGQALAFVTLGIGLWYLSGRPVGAFLKFDGLQLAQGLALGLAFIALAYGTFRAFPRFAEKMVRLQSDTYAFLEKPLTMPAVGWVSLCAGIGEEALFRGGLQTLLGDFTGPHLAIAISSLAFALIHLGKPLITVLLFIISLVFGYVFWATGSLLLVIAAHALYDIFALAYLQREMQRLDVFAGSPASD